MFYGDSITEQLRDLGEECGLWGCPGGGHISRKVFGRWPSINMAIGGARTPPDGFMMPKKVQHWSVAARPGKEVIFRAIMDGP